MNTQNTTIFISYRRKESVLHTLLLYERLQRQFAGQVFMDQQELELGENFRVRIEQQLQDCRVMLAVIGPHWGSERLRNPRDWVRLEITTALQRGIMVIPVLIDGAQMPEKALLPEELHPLLDVYALDLDYERYFDEAANKLVGVLRRCLARSVPEPLPAPVHTTVRHPRESGEPLSPPSLIVDSRVRGNDGLAAGESPLIARPSWATDHGRDEFATPWADIEIGGVVQRMRWIDPGSFLMGCDPSDRNGQSDEKPQHRVTLTKGFWLADTACTQALWEAVMGTNPSHFKGSGDLPVEQVSWDNVTGLFLPKLSNRLGVAVELPAEAQWEYACRAGTKTPFHFGLRITGEQVNCDNRLNRTVPVKERPANHWGLYQMHGNVREWCRAHHRAYRVEPIEDPVDDAAFMVRALRGGAWSDIPSRVRSACRLSDYRSTQDLSTGFRFFLRPT